MRLNRTAFQVTVSITKSAIEINLNGKLLKRKLMQRVVTKQLCGVPILSIMFVFCFVFFFNSHPRVSVCTFIRTRAVSFAIRRIIQTRFDCTIAKIAFFFSFQQNPGTSIKSIMFLMYYGAFFIIIIIKKKWLNEVEFIKCISITELVLKKTNKMPKTVWSLVYRILSEYILFSLSFFCIQCMYFSFYSPLLVLGHTDEKHNSSWVTIK